MKVMIVHGPSLNVLGTREPETYGSDTLDQVNEKISSVATQLGIEVAFYQSAREGEIIEHLHQAAETHDGVLLNPAAYSHTSRAIADAMRSIPIPVVEVHLSNIHAREEWRRTSVTAEAAAGVICGFGAGSYILGLHALKEGVTR